MKKYESKPLPVKRWERWFLWLAVAYFIGRVMADLHPFAWLIN